MVNQWEDEFVWITTLLDKIKKVVTYLIVFVLAVISLALFMIFNPTGPGIFLIADSLIAIVMFALVIITK